MRIFSRRTFVKQAGMCVALGELLLSGKKMAHANPLGLPIGCQTWPVRSMIAKDCPGTLKQLASAGFQSIEMCSPVGYADSGFGGLRKYSGKELRSIIQDAGLTCVSSHFSLDELRKDQELLRRNGTDPDESKPAVSSSTSGVTKGLARRCRKPDTGLVTSNAMRSRKGHRYDESPHVS